MRFGGLIAAAALVVGAVLPAPLVSATPTDDQFLNQVSIYVNGPMNTGTNQRLVYTAQQACSMLADGNKSQVLPYVMGQWKGIVRDSIGFMLAATQAYCPAYYNLYSGA